MGVKPVEYIKDSSTADFAVAGDKKTISESTAVPIQKDVDQGNTKKLDNAQGKYLASLVNPDDVVYNPEEEKNVGANRINTKGEDGEDLSDKNGKAGGAVGAGSAVAAAGVGAAAAIIAMCGTIETSTKAGETFPGGMLICGIITAAMSAITLACSFEDIFDPNLGERKNQTGTAGDTNSIIQEYYDALSVDMDDMVADSERYTNLIGVKTQTDVDTITKIGALRAELTVYESQGDTEKAGEIQAQIDELTEGGEDDPIGEELNTIKTRMDTYSSHYNQSMGVSESGATVAEFLQDGNVMQNYANAAKIACGIGVLVCLVGVVMGAKRVVKDLADIFTAPFATVDSSGLLLLSLSAVMMGYAAAKYAKHAKTRVMQEMPVIK